MFLNYFKTAFRNLWQHKVFSFINILGLGFGLASCFVIMLYILDESSYDRHQKDADRIYRIASKNNKDNEPWASVAAPIAFAVKDKFPEVEQAARLMTFSDISKMLVSNQNGPEPKQFFETNGYYVDSTFFRIFSYPFIYGEGKTALDEPNTLVLSKTMSQKYFGNNNPVGKPLLITTPFGPFNYTVKAVFDDSKYKSHIPAHYFLSMHNDDMWHWVQNQTAFTGNSIFFTYIKLKKGTNAPLFEKKLQTFYNRETAETRKASGISVGLFLQPLKDIYLHSSTGNEIAANGNIKSLYILASIAIFLLLIACINFMNLATARSKKRAKEVGVRKVLGASRKQLVWQFLSESFIMCLISLGIALIIVKLVLPFFNQLTQKNIHFGDNLSLIVWITGLTLVTGLFAGLYPSFYLSSFKPVAVLKGKIIKNISEIIVRKGLVVFQFTISICLVFAAIVTWRQMQYLNNRSLGFDKHRKLIVHLQDGYLNNEENYTTLRNELLKYAEVKSITSGSAYPGIANLNDMLFYGEGQSGNDNVDVHLNAVNDGYLKTLGFHLLSGRGFSKAYHDSAGIILNETAVRQLGYTTLNAVGRSVRYDVNGFHGSLNIVGVVKDFNFESLHTSIQPYGFTTETFGNKYGYLIADVQTKDYSSLLKKVQFAWSRLHPGIPLGFSFLDQDFQRNYGKDQRTATVVTWFTVIAILIACLGLFGLTTFSAEQRIKEIGIRKVLGASVSGITTMLSRDFAVLVLIAYIIATPIAGWVMTQWLQTFAYQVGLSWWIFLVAGAGAFLIALITISFQAIKAAMANPVKSLRTE